MSYLHIQLQSAASVGLRNAARKLSESADALESLQALDNATSRFGEVPHEIRNAVSELRSHAGHATVIQVSGVDIGPIAEMPTPRIFGQYDRDLAMRLADSTMFLVGALIGVPYCFASQQRGRIVLDVFPLTEHKDDQLGCSSSTELEWHNEDAFHPLRASHSLLLCLRNEQKVMTRFVLAHELVLAADVLDELRRPQFIIVPDDSHTYRYNIATSGTTAGSDAAFARIEGMADKPPKIAILSGGHDDPLVCVDFAYMPAELHSGAANDALASLRTAIEECGRSVALAPGDLLILDNRRTVHGRDAFTARYDGSDRWLRRLNVLDDRPTLAGAARIPGTVRLR